MITKKIYNEALEFLGIEDPKGDLLEFCFALNRAIDEEQTARNEKIHQELLKKHTEKELQEQRDYWEDMAYDMRKDDH